MIHVVTYIEVQPSSISEAIDSILEYRQASRAASGNAGTDALQETSRQNRFVMIETWKKDSSLQAHQTAGQTAGFGSRLKTIQNSPFDQRLHQPFAVGLESRVIEAGTLAVVTHVDVPPPRRDETEILLKDLAAVSRSDEGNLRYDVFQQHAPRTNHFTVFAVWRNENAFVTHEMKPHTRQFRDAVGPMLGAPYDDRIYAYLG